MSFLASFVTGFATQATKDIEERDKELRDEATMRWNSLLKEREKASLRAEKRKEDIESQARQLAAYGKGMITEQQIVAIINSGAGSAVIEQLKELKSPLTKEQAGKLVQVEEGQNVSSLPDYIKQVTELKPGAVSAPSEDQMRGAFGLRTRAFEQGLKSASAQTGVSIEDIYKTKLGDMPTIKAIVDLTSLYAEKEPGYDKELSAAKLAVHRAEMSGDPEAIQKATAVRDSLIKAGTPAKAVELDDPKDTINKLVSASDLLTFKASELRSIGGQENVANASQLDQFAKQYTKQAKDLFDKIPRKADAPSDDPFKNLGTFRSDFRGMFSTATEAAQTRIGGSGFVPSVNPVTGDRLLTYTGTDPKAWEAIYEERRKLATDYVNSAVKLAGKVPPGMIQAASGMGIDITQDGKVTVKRLGKEAGNIPESTPATPKPSGVAAARAPSTRTIVRTGTVQSGPDKGRKVIEYSDGTREIQ
jgi:hypothetical protein